MTVHEVFQAEIWSGKTSRKIFVGLGITVLAIVLMGLVGASIYAIESLWLTPKERTIARDALDRLDALRGASGTNGFEAAHDVAKRKVDLAIQAAVTLRDRDVCSTLSIYLNSIESQEKWQELSTNSKDYPSNPGAQSYRKIASSISSSSKSNEDFISRLLHIALK